MRNDPARPAPMSRIGVNRFADGDALARALADRVADDVRAALESAPATAIALSGGTTPRRFFEALSMRDVPWSRVAIVPVDERWVDATHERSNARLIREHLLRGRARDATLVSLFDEAPAPEAALDRIRARLAALPMPFAAVVLGMGTDGHTASWFPDGDRLADALDAATAERVVAMRAPGAGEPRITLTLPAVLATRALYLHIEGAAKWAVLESALADAPLPITTLLARAAAARITPTVFWSP